MAFKALHWETQENMGLQPIEISNAFHSATIVFVVQMIMLSVFSTVIFGAGNPNPIAMGKTPLVIGLRVLVSLLMHMQVECDVRQGLKMMKYLINHTEDFSAPLNAYLIGMAQFLTGVLAEIGCVVFLATI